MLEYWVLIYISDLGYTKIVCESDSSQLIQAVNSTTAVSELYCIVADISSFAVFFEFISFRWISRARNNEADRVLADEIVVTIT